jgi:uncharacterized membrane protein
MHIKDPRLNTSRAGHHHFDNLCHKFLIDTTMATFLDLPGELRNYIHTLCISLRHRFFSVGEYAIRYPMFLPLMIADTQITEEVKSILLTKVGLYLHAEKTYIRRHWADRPSADTAKD